MDEERVHDAAWRERIACVLSGALRVWGVVGTVAYDPSHGGQFHVSTARMHVRIGRRDGWRIFLSDTEVPFGEHAGLPGLLRRLREALAPESAPGRLIIGAQPLFGHDEDRT